MPRFARLIAPGYPHHVTQRASRRQTTFFSESNYEYVDAFLNNLINWDFAEQNFEAHPATA